MAENTSNTTSKVEESRTDQATTIENQRTYQANTEQLRQYALAEDRAARAGDTIIRNLASEIRPPGKFRYYVGFFFSIAGDLLDAVAFILVFFYGVGIPLGWVIDLIIDIPLLLVGFKTNKEIKKMGQANSTIVEKINLIDQKISQYRSTYALALRSARKVKALRKPVRKVARRIKQVRKVITGNPIGRFVTAIVADLIPGLDLVPFRTLAMRQSYKQEKEAYEAFQEALNEDYPAARAEEMAEAEAFIEFEQEELVTQAEE